MFVQITGKKLRRNSRKIKELKSGAGQAPNKSISVYLNPFSYYIKYDMKD